MKNPLLKILVMVGAVVCIAAPAAPGQLTTPRNDKMKTIDVDRLKSRPQDFWSLGIAFTDVVTSFPASREKVGETTYFKLQLEQLGDALVDGTVREQLQQGNPVGREYILGGTVLYAKSGMFSRKEVYHVVIDQATPTAIEGAKSLAEEFARFSLEEGSPETRMVLDVFNTTQRDLISFANDHNTDVPTLFDPTSEQYGQARNIIRRAVRRTEIEAQTTSTEILSGFIFDLLSRRMVSDDISSADADVEMDTTEGMQASETLATEDTPEPAEETLEVVESAPEPASAKAPKPASEPVPLASNASNEMEMEDSSSTETPPNEEPMAREHPLPEAEASLEESDPEEPSPEEPVAVEASVPRVASPAPAMAEDRSEFRRAPILAVPDQNPEASAPTPAAQPRIQMRPSVPDPDAVMTR